MADWYVPDTGTLADGLAQLNPGDTLFLERGTNHGPLAISRSGIQSNPIRIRPFGKVSDAAVITQYKPAANTKFVTVEELEIDATGVDDGIDMTAANITDCRIIGLHVHDAEKKCIHVGRSDGTVQRIFIRGIICERAKEVGIYAFFVRYLNIDGCVFNDNAVNSSDTFHQAYISGCNFVRINSNAFIGGADGLGGGDGGSLGNNGIKFRGPNTGGVIQWNVFAYNKQGLVAHGNEVYGEWCENLILRNNVFYRNGFDNGGGFRMTCAEFLGARFLNVYSNYFLASKGMTNANGSALSFGTMKDGAALGIDEYHVFDSMFTNNYFNGHENHLVMFDEDDSTTGIHSGCSFFGNRFYQPDVTNYEMIRYKDSNPIDSNDGWKGNVYQSQRFSNGGSFNDHFETVIAASPILMHFDDGNPNWVDHSGDSTGIWQKRTPNDPPELTDFAKENGQLATKDGFITGLKNHVYSPRDVVIWVANRAN